MNKFKALIIEDEKLARDLVKSYLESHSEIELSGEYADGFTGLKAINEIKPDIVFLDIQMPRITGFEMIELLDHKPEIIFTTAFDEFAIKAFDINAIDYLLKPFSSDRFAMAISKAIEKLSSEGSNTSKLDKLINHVDVNRENLERIVVKKNGKIVIIPVDSIQYIEAQDDYVMLYTAKDRFLKQQTMKFYDNMLSEKEFIRIHRSFIVKINQISELEPYEKESYIVHLKSGIKLKSSKSGYKRIRRELDIY